MARTDMLGSVQLVKLMQIWSIGHIEMGYSMWKTLQAYLGIQLETAVWCEHHDSRRAEWVFGGEQDPKVV